MPEAAKPKPPADLTIDFDGLERRVARVPVEAANYAGVAALEGHLLYVTGPPFYYGRQADVKSALKLYSFKDRKETSLLDDVSQLALSADRKKILVRQGPAGLTMDATTAGGAATICRASHTSATPGAGPGSCGGRALAAAPPREVPGGVRVAPTKTRLGRPGWHTWPNTAFLRRVAV